MKVKFHALFLLLFTFFIFSNTFADTRQTLQVAQSAVTLNIGASTSVTVSNAAEKVTATSSNTSVATASYNNRAVNIKALKAGTSTITVQDRNARKTIVVTVLGLQVPLSATLKVGATTTINASNATGTVQVQSEDKSIVTASITNNSVITLRGLKVGSTTVTVWDKFTSIPVKVSVTAASKLSALPSSQVALTVGGQSLITISNATGQVTVKSSDATVATIACPNSSSTCGTATVKGLKVGSATLTISDGSGASITITATVMSGTTTSNYTLLAWNDLGMHCMDGLDFSVFSILPPYNTLHAQLKDKNGALVTSGVTLTYEAVEDSTKSINTYSAGKAGFADKTNFWDEITLMLGLPANALPRDTGLNLDGMTSGNPDPGNKTPSLTPQALIYNAAFGWYEAEGIPITPFDDAGNKNFYPTVKVVATDLLGTKLAETITVLPVSDEMTCISCHKSTTNTDAVSIAARPAAGWVNNTANPDKDWKQNVLKLHDEKNLASPVYVAALAANNFNPAGLLATAKAGRPVLCVLCHKSNAYFDKRNSKTAMPGIIGIKPFTEAIHSKHANVINPGTTNTLDEITDITTCYQCHPGSKTNCMRGAMSKPTDAAGNNAISCQNCHGNLSAVGSPLREGWFEEPTCQACHNSDKATNHRALSAIDPVSKALIVPVDTTFATNANKPVTDLNLYRFSTGHGGLQCEACHGSTHAEYPSKHVDDNTQSIAVQGHEGPVAECTACHKTVPTTVNGGPHGMHTTGDAWVRSHQNTNKNGTPNCAYCHGTTSAGTPLSAIKVDKTINAGDFGTKNWKAGYQVSCYSCHNGPNP